MLAPSDRIAEVYGAGVGVVARCYTLICRAKAFGTKVIHRADVAVFAGSRVVLEHAAGGGIAGIVRARVGVVARQPTRRNTLPLEARIEGTGVPIIARPGNGYSLTDARGLVTRIGGAGVGVVAVCVDFATVRHREGLALVVRAIVLGADVAVFAVHIDLAAPTNQEVGALTSLRVAGIGGAGVGVVAVLALTRVTLPGVSRHVSRGQFPDHSFAGDDLLGEDVIRRPLAVLSHLALKNEPFRHFGVERKTASN